MKIAIIFILTLFFCHSANAECIVNNMTLGVEGNCPEDVRDYVERVNGCGHFISERDPNDDAERKEFLDKNINELECDKLSSQQEEIKSKYRNDGQISEFLKKNGDW
jgi:hypothetical protein